MMRTRRLETLGLVAVTLLAVLLVDVGLALAQAPAPNGGGSTTQIGKNLGNEVQSWGKALLLGVAALVGIPALAKRDLGGSLVVALIAVVLGGFVFAPGEFQTLITNFWSTIGR